MDPVSGILLFIFILFLVAKLVEAIIIVVHLILPVVFGILLLFGIAYCLDVIYFKLKEREMNNYSSEQEKKQNAVRDSQWAATHNHSTPAKLAPPSPSSKVVLPYADHLNQQKREGKDPYAGHQNLISDLKESSPLKHQNMPSSNQMQGYS